MRYLYHRVPPNMQGTILYPLNRLKEQHPDAYAEQAKRYEGREQLMQEKIPPLNCLWNDVIHLSAVNPLEIKAELKKGGKHLRAKAFFKIDPFSLEKENTIVYLYRKPTMNRPIPTEFTPYNPNDISQYAIFPEAAKKYYAEMLESGGRLFLWHLIPHILYKGSIDTKDLSILHL